jgi:UDP-N-acetylmuramoyl-tripeptide--D-alanyl-D-alanine ligase
VIADCYNANPDSLAAALDTLVHMPRGGGRVAVVGSMLELGASAALHRESARDVSPPPSWTWWWARACSSTPWSPFVGELGDRLVLADDAEAAFGPLAERLGGDEVVLLKGSRGVALEQLLPLLEERFGGGAGPGKGG